MIRLYRSWWAWMLAGLVIAPLLPFPLGIVVGGPLAMRGGWLLAGHVGQPCGWCGTRRSYREAQEDWVCERRRNSGDVLE